MVSLVKSNHGGWGTWTLLSQGMNTSSSGGRKYHRQKELCDLAMCTGCEDVGKKGSGELDQALMIPWKREETLVAQRKDGAG